MNKNSILVKNKSFNKIYKNNSIKKNTNVLREIKEVLYLKKPESFLIVYLNIMGESKVKLLKNLLASFKLELKSIKPKKIKLFFKNNTTKINSLYKNNIYLIKINKGFCFFEQFGKFQNQIKTLPFNLFGLFDNGFFYYLNKEKFSLSKKPAYTELTLNLTSPLQSTVNNLSYLYNNLCLILTSAIKKNDKI